MIKSASANKNMNFKIFAPNLNDFLQLVLSLKLKLNLARCNGQFLLLKNLIGGKLSKYVLH